MVRTSRCMHLRLLALALSCPRNLFARCLRACYLFGLSTDCNRITNDFCELSAQLRRICVCSPHVSDCGDFVT